MQSLPAGHGPGHSPSSSSSDARRLREENSALRQQLKLLDKPSKAGDMNSGERRSEEARELARELKLVWYGMDV